MQLSMNESEDKDISMCDLLETSDHRLWAQVFIKQLTENPLVDQADMEMWFANAMVVATDFHEKKILDHFAYSKDESDRAILDKLLEVMSRSKWHYYDINTYIDPNPETIDYSLKPTLHFIGNIVEDDGEH